MHYPVTNITAAVEYQHGRRRNFEDGWRFSDDRIQMTFRYSFSANLGEQ